MKKFAITAAALVLASTGAFAQASSSGSMSSGSMSSGNMSSGSMSSGAMSKGGAMSAMSCQQMMDKATPMMGSMAADKKAMAMKEMDAAKMAMSNKDEAGCQSHMKMAMGNGGM